MKRFMKRCLFTVATSLLLLSMTSCKQSPAAADPEKLITDALAKLESAQSLESVTISETSLSLDDVSQNSSSEMKVTLIKEPLTAQVGISMKTSGSLSGDQEASLDAYMMTEGEDMFAYLSEDGQWVKERITSIDLNSFIENPIEKFGYFVNGKKEVTDLGAETIDGKEARILEIKSDPAIFSEYAKEIQAQFGLSYEQLKNCGDFVTKAWISEDGLVKYDIDLTNNIQALGDALANDSEATEEMQQQAEFIKGLTLKLNTTVVSIDAAPAITLPEEAKTAIEFEYPQPFEQSIESSTDQSETAKPETEAEVTE